jgi:hypothetical protein
MSAELLWAVAGLAWVLVALFTWALCIAAARGDRWRR